MRPWPVQQLPPAARAARGAGAGVASLLAEDQHRGAPPGVLEQLARLVAGAPPDLRELVRRPPIVAEVPLSARTGQNERPSTSAMRERTCREPSSRIKHANRMRGRRARLMDIQARLAAMFIASARIVSPACTEV